MFKLGDALTQKLLEVVTLWGSQIVVGRRFQGLELARQRGDTLDLADQVVGRPLGGWTSTLVENPQSQPGIFEELLAGGRGALEPDGIEFFRLSGGELGRGDRLGQPQTILATLPRKRYQVPHGGLGRNPPQAHVLLHGLR